MRGIAVVGLVALAGFVLAASSSLAADSCPAPCAKPPVTSRHVSTPGAPIPLPGFGPILSVSNALQKGKAKRVIVVDATLMAGGPPFGPFHPFMQVDVNGILMEPTAGLGGFACGLGPGTIGTDCGNAGGAPAEVCTVTSTFWLDIDQNPSLIGVPLNVTLTGGDCHGFPGMAVASMAIRLQKK